MTNGERPSINSALVELYNRGIQKVNETARELGEQRVADPSIVYDPKFNFDVGSNSGQKEILSQLGSLLIEMTSPSTIDEDLQRMGTDTTTEAVSNDVNQDEDV